MSFFTDPDRELLRNSWHLGYDIHLVDDPTSAEESEAYQVIPNDMGEVGNWLQVVAKPTAALSDPSRPYNVIYAEDNSIAPTESYVVKIRIHGFLSSFSLAPGGDWNQ